MTCRQYGEAIQELVDGTLGPIRRTELDLHLDTCPACRALASDLQRLRELASEVEPVTPPDSVWLQIAGRLRQEGRVVEPAGGTAHHLGRHLPLLAMAATVTLAVGVSLYILLSAIGAGDDGARNDTAAAVSTMESIEAEFRLAEQHYQNAIAKLEEAARSEDDTIDPLTADTLQKNLQVIDLAIAESRAALRSEPLNVPARDSLFEALRRKVVLLQDTVALMNEMRKGNSAGAAELVDALNKS